MILVMINNIIKLKVTIVDHINIFKNHLIISLNYNLDSFLFKIFNLSFNHINLIFHLIFFFGVITKNLQLLFIDYLILPLFYS